MQSGTEENRDSPAAGRRYTEGMSHTQSNFSKVSVPADRSLDLSAASDWLDQAQRIEQPDLNARLHQEELFGLGVTFRAPQAFQQGNLALHISDLPKEVLANRRALAEKTLPLENWVLASQKHTDQVIRVSAQDAGKGALEQASAPGPADALWTTEPGLLLGVITADCIGLILTDPSVPSLAVIHSGWRGTAQAIVLRTVQAMKKQGLLHPERAQAWFSPSLLASSLEVGNEVVQAMEEMAGRESLDITGCVLPHPDPDKAYIDNQKLCMRMLEKEGFLPENIHESRIDTKTDPDCFSFRRDGLQAEHFTFGWIRPRTETQTEAETDS